MVYSSSGATSATGIWRSSSCVSTSSSLPTSSTHSCAGHAARASSNRLCACSLRSCPSSRKRSGTPSIDDQPPAQVHRSHPLPAGPAHGPGRRGGKGDGAASGADRRGARISRKLGVEEKTAVPIARISRRSGRWRLSEAPGSSAAPGPGLLDRIPFRPFPKAPCVRRPASTWQLSTSASSTPRRNANGLRKILARMEKDEANAERQLGNADFLSKAPAKVIDGLRRRSAESSTLIPKTRGALETQPEKFWRARARPRAFTHREGSHGMEEQAH